MLNKCSEKKFLITGPTDGGYSGKNYFDLTSQITQGTARNQRVGTKIFMRYLRMTLTIESANVTSDGNFRLAIVIPKEAVSTVADFPSLNSQWDTEKFYVLWEKRFRLAVGNQANEYSNTPIDKQITKTIKVMRSVYYVQGSGVAQKNQIIFAHIYGSTGIAGDSHTLFNVIKEIYTDV